MKTTSDAERLEIVRAIQTLAKLDLLDDLSSGWKIWEPILFHKHFDALYRARLEVREILTRTGALRDLLQLAIEESFDKSYAAAIHEAAYLDTLERTITGFSKLKERYRWDRLPRVETETKAEVKAEPKSEAESEAEGES